MQLLGLFEMRAHREASLVLLDPAAPLVFKRQFLPKFLQR